MPIKKMFSGFTDKETFTPIPDAFFHHLLTTIDDAGELKITLYTLWRIAHMESQIRYLRHSDFTNCNIQDLDSKLEKAVQRGIILEVRKEADTLYFLNSPRGRAAAEAFERGQWEPSTTPFSLPLERPNVFQIYEENMGPLTPLIADALKEAEQTYLPEWVTEAIEIAVKNNKRNWRYVEAILKRWKVEGHAKKRDQKDAIQGSERYTKSEFAEYLQQE